MATLARPAIPVLSLVVLVAASILLNYIDRGTIAVAAPLVKQELGLSATAFGIAFPGSSKIICRHVPASRRGIANAAVATGIALGPAVGTLAGGLLMTNFGWRAMFVVFGLLTLLWLLPWSALVKRFPAEHRHTAEPRFPLKRVLATRALWTTSLGHFAVN